MSLQEAIKPGRPAQPQPGRPLSERDMATAHDMATVDSGTGSSLSPRRQRWIGVGNSCAPDAVTAGAGVASKALVGEDGRLLVFFGIVGFYPHGEIARLHGTAGFHNQTLVVLALS